MAKFKPDSQELFQKQLMDMKIGDKLFFEDNYYLKVPGGWLVTLTIALIPFTYVPEEFSYYEPED